MMLPILISLSLAPVSYFFCASAGLAATHRATDAISARIAFRMTSSLPWSAFRLDGIGMRSGFLHLRMSFSENRYPLFRDMRQLSAALLHQSAGDQSDQAGGAGRHQIDHQQQDHAVDSAG